VLSPLLTYVFVLFIRGQFCFFLECGGSPTAAVSCESSHLSKRVHWTGWCYGVIQATPGPGYPLKRRNVYSFVITIREWTAINLDDTTVLGCICSEAGEGPPSQQHSWPEWVVGAWHELRKRWRDAEMGYDFGRHLTMLPSRGLRPAQLAPLASRQSTLRCSNTARKVRLPRMLESSPQPTLPPPPHVAVAASHWRTRDCLRPHMRHSYRDVPSECLLTCKL
jgi:hypothetical protein